MKSYVKKKLHILYEMLCQTLLYKQLYAARLIGLVTQRKSNSYKKENGNMRVLTITLVLKRL